MEDVPSRVRCRNCGADNFPSSERCWKCDRPLKHESAESQPDPTPAPPLYDPSQVEPGAPYPTAKPQSASTLVILGFTFGGIGWLMCCGHVGTVFSIVGIVLGAVALAQGDKMGKWVLLVSVLPLVLTVIVALVFGASILAGIGSASGSFPWKP